MVLKETVHVEIQTVKIDNTMIFFVPVGRK